MELTDKHIEVIRDAARTVNYGSVTIQISADKPGRLELNVQNRIRVDEEPTEHKNTAPRKDSKGFQD